MGAVTLYGSSDSGNCLKPKWVAERLGYLHVDSGSLYRAVTAAMLRTHLPAEQWTSGQIVAEGVRISLRADTSTFIALIDGEPVGGVEFARALGAL